MTANRPSKGRNLPVGMMVVGSEMAGFTVVGVVLDYAIGTMPWFTIGLTLLGFVAAFSHLVRMVRPPAPPANSESEGRR